jgi:PII-like signaling protein
MDLTTMTMQIPRAAVLLRIFCGENDRYEHKPLYEAIVLKAREMQLGGATVLRGAVGFGHSSQLHTTKILRLSQDLPLIIEIIDAPDKIDVFLPVLDKMMTSGLVTIEKVQVLHYGGTKPESGS